MPMKRILVLFTVLFSLATGASLAQDAGISLNLDVKEFHLENGMQFLVVERHTTPQVAARLAIRAGSALEESERTGIAHLLEHMMFKGTKNFGTLDYKKDAELQNRIEAAYQVILSEQRKRQPDRELIKAKRAEMEALRLEVQKIFVPKVFSAQLGKNGAVGVNAFTSRDQTQYTLSIPSDMIEQWFSIASEQLFEPSWREFYVEKSVVQREWAFRYVNDPEGAAWLDLHATAYTAHPYRNPTIGWKSDMERFNTLSAIEFHKKYYKPTNAVAVLVGDITVEEVKRLAGIYFERYPAGIRATEEVTAEPLQQGPRKSIRYLKGARTPLVRIGFHGARMGTDDFYALDAMSMILSHGIGGRFDQNIVNRGLAVQAWASNPDNRYGGMVVLGGSPNEPDALSNQNLSEEKRRQIYLEASEAFEKILLGEIEKLKTEKVTARDLERIKKLNRREFLERMRSNESLAGTLAALEVETGWQYLTSYLEKLEKVTAEDIQRVAWKYIRPDNQTSAYVIPGGDPDQPPEQYSEVRAIGASAAQRIEKPQEMGNHSIYPTPAGWKHPLSFERKPKKIEYPPAETEKIGSVPFFYLPDRELPLIDLTILLKAGSVDVDENRTGLTAMLDAMLLRGGTESYSPQELAAILDEKAIRISVSVGEEASSIHLSVLKSEWETGLHLLKEILTKPRLDPQVLSIVKNQAVTGLQRQGEDAAAVSTREAQIWLFKGHPYGRDPLLGLKTITGITGEDLKTYLRTYFVPSNMVFALSGDIGKEKAVIDLEAFLQNFPDAAVPERNLKEPPESKPVLALIHKPGQVQSQVTLGLRSVPRSHPDFWKISLLTSIYGGSDSILYQRLRDDLGLVYAAYFGQTYKWKTGYLVGYIGSKGDNTADAIEEALTLMQRLHGAVPEEEFKLKQLDTLNSFVFNVDTPAALANTYGQYYLRKEPLDTLEKIQEAYMSASKTEMERLAGQYLLPQKAVVFVVADRTIQVSRDGKVISLKEDLEALSGRLGIPFQEIALR
ncbi:MAG: insulinase family protein [Desulfobacteraceae bacterium]|nr:MAG: insulinase family protein [Desulfobacteraceae bacterium]